MGAIDTRFTREASEDGEGEGFVSGVLEGGHGLSLTFQSGLLLFIADFQQHRICSARISEMHWMLPACTAATRTAGYEVTAPSSHPGTQRPIVGYRREDW